MGRSENSGLNAAMQKTRNGGGDDAVSSVVALMLLLAVIATFVSLYATTYVPGLKEQSEIDRTNSVKEAFMEFSSDIEHIVYKKAGGISYGYPIPLGAGDVLMSPEKSSGMLAVKDIGNFTDIYIDSQPVANCSMVNVAFEPSYTFWEEQGYVWQYGYVNVTKGGRATPLEAYTMEDVLASESEFSFSPFGRSFIGFEPEKNSSGHLSNLTVNVVNITPGQSKFASGNGHAVLRVKAEISGPEEFTPTWLNFTFTNSSTDAVASNFSANLANELRKDLDDLNCTYTGDVKLHPPIVADDHDTITLEFLSDVEVTVRTLTVYVSAS
ncbi:MULTISPECIES: hypothetical protein [unclassified Methanoculleus]|jgi:hypothetical protein|uniref:hypothetical protein n=1 Tax=unclassified Methanoculleus TaxID=2619537 RepID=UPI0025F0051A|nr:hypothetical protein [Methanoculleus sp. UBA377]